MVRGRDRRKEGREGGNGDNDAFENVFGVGGGDGGGVG